MHTRNFLIATFSAALLSGSALAANYGLTEEKVNSLVEQYIHDHPEVILESIRNWQQSQKMQTQQNQQALVQQYKEAIFKAEHSPRVGPLGAKITLVEFYDYNCPACKAMFNSLNTVMSNHPGEMQVIFKELPIFGEVSVQNSRLAMALYRIAPEHYFAWHRDMMTHEGRVNEQVALEIAARLGVDTEALKKEAATQEVSDMVEKDVELAQLLQIQGTPALIIGDQLINSGLSPQDVESIIAQTYR